MRENVHDERRGIDLADENGVDKKQDHDGNVNPVKKIKRLFAHGEDAQNARNGKPGKNDVHIDLEVFHADAVGGIVEHLFVEMAAEGKIGGIGSVFNIPLIDFACGDAEKEIENKRGKRDGNQGNAEDRQNRHR